MSLVNTDDSSSSAIQALRGALISEVDATRLYDSLIQKFPQHKAELTEIKNDEIDHQGILLRLIITEDPSQMDHLNQGLVEKGSTKK